MGACAGFMCGATPQAVGKGVDRIAPPASCFTAPAPSARFGRTSSSGSGGAVGRCRFVAPDAPSPSTPARTARAHPNQRCPFLVVFSVFARPLLYLTLFYVRPPLCRRRLCFPETCLLMGADGAVESAELGDHRSRVDARHHDRGGRRGDTALPVSSSVSPNPPTLSLPGRVVLLC